MENLLTPQERMDKAFENYFALSNILKADLDALLTEESNSPHWRRNFIRASASLIEGYAHSFREFCSVSFDCVAPEITKREGEVISNEIGFSANERIKLTLRAAYKLFELQAAPNFGGLEWPRAQGVLQKRHRLMHPKCPEDLEITEELWSDLRNDVTWLIAQLFNFISELQRKHTA